MDGLSQYAEYSVRKQYSGSESARLHIGFGLLLAATALVMGILAYLAFVFFFSLVVLVVILGVLLLVLEYRAYRGKTDRVIDYRVAGGELAVDMVMRGTKRKALYRLDLSACETIAPYRDPYKTTVDRVEVGKTYDFTGDPETPDLYFALFRDSKDSSIRHLLFFEPSAKMLKLIRLSHPRTVIVPVGEEGNR